MSILRVATGNKGKLRKFREILSPLGYEVLGIDDLSELEIIEDGDSFEANAIIKAKAVMEAGELVSDEIVSALIGDKLALTGAPWRIAIELGENFNGLGFAIIGLFVFCWLASYAIYRWKRFDEIEVSVGA